MIVKRFQYGLLLLAAIVFHIYVVDYISFWIFALLIMLPVVSVIITAFTFKGIVAELIIKTASVQTNDIIPIHLKIYNKYFISALKVKIKLTIRNELLQQEHVRTFLITANHCEQTIEQSVSSQYCGMIKCNISELRVYDALGLFSFCKNIDSNHFIAVLPSVHSLLAINSATLQDIQNNITSIVIKGNDPSEIIDVREYRDGDRITRIHWKLSDKYDQLMVKNFGDPTSNDLLMLFDLNGNSNEQISGLLDVVYSISDFLLKNQIAYEMKWYDSLHEKLIHNIIAQNNDLRIVFESILTNGRAQKQPWTFKNCCDSYDNKAYSVVLYICSEITSNTIALIQKLYSRSHLKILLVAESRSIHTELTFIDLNNIKDSLGNLVI